LVLLTALAAPTARAEDETAKPSSPFRPRHGVLLSAERLFGFTYLSRSEDQPNAGNGTGTPTIDTSGTTFGPLGPAATTALYSSPRLAFDAQVWRGFTAGAAISYFRISVKRTIDGAGVFTNSSTSTLSAVVLAPRVGYLAPLTASVALWPRVGFTYFRAWTSSNGSQTLGLYALTLEVPLAFRLTEHVLLLAGPTLDLGLAGTTSSSGGNQPRIPGHDVTETDVGVSCAFAATF
jgi:hypothetical protein